MRFGKKIERYRHKKNKKFFAWLPITINGETRWLEMVNVKGYYFVGLTTNRVLFQAQSFID